MNILFIEDEKELSITGMMQLELKGYKVFPAYNLAQAQAILDDPKCPIHFLITDHRLPDGMGIEFVIEMKKSFPKCKSVVVSGCLTDRDIQDLEAHAIPYHQKPLLYGKVIDQLRRLHAAQASEPIEAEVEVEDETAADVSKKRGRKLWPFS